MTRGKVYSESFAIRLVILRYKMFGITGFSFLIIVPLMATNRMTENKTNA